MNTLGIAIAVAVAALAITIKKTPKAQKVRVTADRNARKPIADKPSR